MYDIPKLKEFDNHTSIISFHNTKTNLNGFIAIHRGGLKGPSFGATRLWDYQSESEALKDALKLSRLMSYKSALAGLKYGGAKAVIIKPKGSADHSIKNYASYINLLGGHFITGADVGIDKTLLNIMAKQSPFIVGLRTDPVKFTVLGVFEAIQACLKEVFNTSSLEGRTFAIQGLGKTGAALLTYLYPQAKKVYVADIDKVKTKWAKTKFPNIEIVEPEKIDQLSVDVFCPCALGSAVNTKNITNLRCRMIVGSANNQLENDALGDKLFKMGILYAPDYLVNAGGLISVVDEYENRFPEEKRILQRVGNIGSTLQKIISKSKKTNKPTNLVANEMAEKIFNEFV